MKIKKLTLLILSQAAAICSFAQNVGIGTTIPLAGLHVADSSVLFSATGFPPSVPGNPPVQGAGRRMMWYADKAAFRAGYISGVEWDKNNVGKLSFATGENTTASGYASFATGYNTIASGSESFSTGNFNTASGSASSAIGYSNDAIGDYAIAAGQGTTASGSKSFSMGYSTTASGTNSAMGDRSTASGDASTAMGFNTTASGNYSTSMGTCVSSNNQDGSFLIGDRSTVTVMNSPAANNFRARFANGYHLYTSANSAISCSLGAGDNAWITGSDVRTKENFAVVDGENFLKKIAEFNLTSWNYKTQDPKIFRHYSPMAQDFFAAFGKDEYGTISNDTTINSAEFAGISFIAIKALEKKHKRSSSWKKKITN